MRFEDKPISVDYCSKVDIESIQRSALVKVNPSHNLKINSVIVFSFQRDEITIRFWFFWKFKSKLGCLH